MQDFKVKAPEFELTIANSFGNVQLDQTIQTLMNAGVSVETIVGALKKEFQQQLK